jgi:SP family arabinose:H+ symporter-like MFS transporter
MKFYLLFCCTIAAFGGFLVGFDNAFIGATPLLQKAFGLSDMMLGMLVSLVVVGALLGSLISGSISYRVGTKKVFLVAAGLCLIVPLVYSTTSSLNTIIICRILLGVAYGIFSTLPPIYLSEITPAAVRGRFVTLYQLQMVIGSMLSFVVMYYLERLGAESWRYMLSTLSVPSLFLFVGLFFIPESPRWLVRNQKPDQAKRLLVKLDGNEFAETELNAISESFKSLHREKISDLLSPKLRKVALFGVLLAVFQQLTGISAIFNFAPIIFQQTGASLSSSFSQTLLVGVVNFVLTIAGMLLVDRWGRRPLMIWGLLFIILSLSGISFLFFTDQFKGTLALIFILLFIASFAISAGPVMWVLLSEIFPQQIKGIGTSLATFSMWIFVGVTSFAFPVILNRWGGGATFAIFAVISLLHLIFIQRYIPETKGKSLEEIDRYFAS